MTIAPLDQPKSLTAPTLAIVIVNFNSWPDSQRLVKALTSSGDSTDDPVEVILVDNASEDPPPPGLSRRSRVLVIPRSDNAGFAAGVNTAWRQTSARWLLLLNPDIDAGPDLVLSVLRRIHQFEARPNHAPGIVGFALKNKDGSRQHSVGSFPTLARFLREIAKPRSRRKYWPLRKTTSGPVPWVTGACLLVQSALLAELGGMDEEFFLYHEEVALCRSAWDRGWTVEFDDSIAVRHLHPLQSRAVSPVLRVVTRHSKLLYFLKFRPRWEFSILAWIIAWEATFRRLLGRISGREAEAKAWETIRHIARDLGEGRGPRGVEVRALAENAVRRAARLDLSCSSGGSPRSSRRRSSIHLDVFRRSR